MSGAADVGVDVAQPQRAEIRAVEAEDARVGGKVALDDNLRRTAAGAGEEPVETGRVETGLRLR